MIRKGNILEVEKLKFNWEKKNSFNLNISKLVIKNIEKVVLLSLLERIKLKSKLII